MSLLEHAPQLAPAHAIEIADKRYNLKVAAAYHLPSERDQNFVLETSSAEKLVLKIANTLEALSLLEAQNAALHHVASLSIAPTVVANSSGESISTFSDHGKQYFVRLVTYLPGIPLGELTNRCPSLLRDLGRRVGQLDRALADFDHDALHRDFHWDLANGLAVIDDYAPLIKDTGLRALIDSFAGRFQGATARALPLLSHSVIHNDVNDYNVLVSDDGQRITGIIDFGDMVHSFTIADLAVAAAYAILGAAEPLETASEVVNGYAAVCPILDDEIEVLFDLICLRLCMSVCLAAHQQRQRPNDAYLGISQRDIRALLPQLAEIDRNTATDVFARACAVQ